MSSQVRHARLDIPPGASIQAGQPPHPYHNVPPGVSETDALARAGGAPGSARPGDARGGGSTAGLGEPSRLLTGAPGRPASALVQAGQLRPSPVPPIFSNPPRGASGRRNCLIRGGRGQAVIFTGGGSGAVGGALVRGGLSTRAGHPRAVGECVSPARRGRRGSGRGGGGWRRGRGRGAADAVAAAHPQRSAFAVSVAVAVSVTVERGADGAVTGSGRRRHQRQRRCLGGGPGGGICRDDE